MKARVTPATDAEVDAEAAEVLRDPQRIEALSYARVRAELELEGFPEALRPLVLRLVYACALPEIAGRLAWAGDPAGAARRALEAGRPILCDVRMVEVGIARSRLPAANAVRCFAHRREARELARRLETTRTAAGVELWQAEIADAVVAIGNAPTALFHLLDRLDRWSARPAAIFAFPVGFVGAAESKEALIRNCRGVPYLTLRGRFGGSALAAAAINALCGEERG